MRPRLTFLDLLRSWAALVMIEVHVVNTFLMAEYRDASWFPVLNYINGLVAPAFLFVAGFAFAFTADRSNLTSEEKRTKLYRQLRKIGLIAVAGYSLHLPGFGWSFAMNATADGWLKFYQADILHCIAVGLLLLVVAREFLGGAKGVLRVAGIVGALSVVIAPLAWTFDAQANVPAPIAAYVNGLLYSQFPLFPWLAFMMAGAVVASTYPSQGSSEQFTSWTRQTGLVGLILLVVAVVARWPDWAIGLPDVHIRANPWFVLERLAVLLILLWCAAQWNMRQPELSPGLRDVSRESLFVYYTHLMIISGDWFNGHSLSFLYHRQFGIVQTIIAAAVLIAAMTAGAWAWQRAKQRYPRNFQIAFSASVVIVIVVFFFR